MANEIKQYFDSLAPSWDAMDCIRDERISALLRRVDIKVGDSVLDLACGTGRISGLLHDMSQADILGVDIAPKMISIAKEKYSGKDWASFEVADFLPMTTEKPFDVIVIYNAYPHFLKRGELQEALCRNLKAHGKFAIVHSLSREQLSEHHNHLDPKITRALLPVEEEAAFYEDCFSTVIAEEGDDFYLIVGQKR